MTRNNRMLRVDAAQSAFGHLRFSSEHLIHYSAQSSQSGVHIVEFVQTK